MAEIVAACVSQFHDDANSFELLLAYADGREIGHSVSRKVAQNIASELIEAAGGEYAAKDAEIERLRECRHLISDWIVEGTEDLPDDTPVTIKIGNRSVILDELKNLRTALNESREGK
jgi:hypothetical protein